MLVVAVFSLAHQFQHESGLLAVIVMGFVLVNQRWVDIGHLVEFNENLRVLLISSLFIVLAARIDITDLTRLAPRGLLFVAVLVLVGRPLSVLVSTFRTRLATRERVFLAWMAPRGIIVAAVSSVFAIRLETLGYQDTGVIVSISFMTIITTVAVYGLTAPILARRLGIAESHPQGLLFVGAHGWVRDLASLLQWEGYRVLMVDSNRDHTYAARMAKLPTYTGSILAEHTLDKIDLGGIGRLLAVTPNDWVNVLAVQRFERILGRANCFQLPPQQETSKQKRHKYLQARWLFDEAMTHAELQRRYADGFTAKATRLTEEFDNGALLARCNNDAAPLLLIDEDGRLTLITPELDKQPHPGQTVISLVKEETRVSPTQDTGRSTERSGVP